MKMRACIPIVASSACLLGFLSSSTHAQDVKSSVERRSLIEEVMVTARKKDENILDVPLSLQAFTDEDLQAAGLTELEAIADFTPNLDFQNLGNSQPGRFNSAIRFRGMEIGITIPTNQTGGFFVDGVNVLGGASSVPLSDVSRVEVIRGPQPVYFGRGTFGGAINYTTITPGEEFSGGISASYSPKYGSNDMTVYVEGGLAKNLNARLTYSAREVGSAFTANDGGRLGEETTQGLSTIISWVPADNFSAKLRLAYSEDDDSSPATTFVPYSEYGNIPAGEEIRVKTDAGYVTTNFGRDYYRGDIPYVKPSNNTGYYDLVNGENTGDIFRNYDVPGDTPSLDHFGLRTKFLMASLAFDYDISESLTLSGLFGVNDRGTTQLRDADQYDSEAWTIKTYLELESHSSELRLTWDNGGAWRVLGGISYSEMSQEGDVDGGYNAYNQYFAPNGVLIGYGSSLLDVVDIETWGFFGSVEFDVTDWMTLALEGRYQDDTIENRTGTTMDELVDAKDIQYEKFLPRVSVVITPMEDASLFFSYAEGILPGGYNAFFDTLSADDRERFSQENPNVSPTVDEEKLETYELGWKQSILDGDAWFSAVLFTQKWSNMKSTGLVLFTDEDSVVQFLTPTIAGSSTQEGIELEGHWRVSDNLDLHASYGYVDSTYDKFVASSMNSTLGLPFGTNYRADGNTLPRSPKHSGVVSATWNDKLNDAWDYYLRGDVTYRGETYTDELNLTTIESYMLFNVRVGIENFNGLQLELFCNNCADEEGWATGRRVTDFGQQPATFTAQGAVVDPIRPREIGIRTSYQF